MRLGFTTPHTLGLRGSRKLSAGVGAAIGSIGATFAGQFTLLVSGVLSARVLGPEDRGHVALIMVVASVICGVVPFGSSNAMTYFVAKNRAEARAVVNVMRTPTLIQVVLVVFIQATALSFLLVDQSKELQYAGLISLGIGPGIIGHTFGLRIIQGLQLFRSYNVLRALPASLYTVTLLMVFAMGQLDVITTVSASVVSNFISAIIVLLIMYRSVPHDEFRASEVSRAAVIRYGAKGFLGTASPLETFRIDQLIIGLFLSPTALGIYVTSLAYTTLPRVISQSLAMIAVPRIACQSNEIQSRRLMWKFFGATTIASLSLAFVLMILAGFLVPFVFGAEFQGAVAPAQILVGASVLFGGRRILGESLRGMGYTGVSALAEVVSWIVLFVGLALLVPGFQLMGVAWALVLASGASFVVVFLGAVERKGTITGHGSKTPRARSRYGAE